MNRSSDIEVEASREKLLNAIGNPPDLVFVRGWGNLGDELIWAGTRQLLYGLKYREVGVRNLQNVTGHTALFTGGGGWSVPFHQIPAFLAIVEEQFEHVIVLPTTFDTSLEITRTLLAKTKALVFARELVSYNQIKGLCNADIAHDTAFFFDFEKYKQDGSGVLNAFRTDGESIHPVLPEGNIDISTACSSLDEWLWTISKYAIIRTDRAHVMIAGALLGKKVEYLTSSYHKVPAIAEYGLKNYPVTRIPEESMPRIVMADVKDSSKEKRPSRFKVRKIIRAILNGKKK